MSRTGELSHSGSEIEVEWKIADFFSLSKIDEYFFSPTFNFSGAYWCLICYPNGHSMDSSSGGIGLYLYREDSGPPVSLKFAFGFKAAEDKKKILVGSLSRVFQEANSGFGFPNAISRSSLLEKISGLQPSGVPVITCKLEQPPSNMTACVISSVEKLLQDMKRLLLGGKDSDVTIRVQDKHFTVHRSILGARTPLFYSMFEHDIKEKNTGIVSIDHCDAGVFRTFLLYVYTGSVEELSPGNMFPLYEVADRYQLSELKNHCLECMKSELSVEIFCNVITLALKYEEKELMELATTFFTENATRITATAEWVEFMKGNATQANELFVKTLVKQKEE